MPGLPKTHQSLGMLGNYPRHQWLYPPTLTPPNRAGPHGIPTYSYYTILVTLLYNIHQYYLKYDINKSIGREDEVRVGSKGSSNVGARETTQRNSTTEISQEQVHWDQPEKYTIKEFS